jgi:fructose-specific phosphotransferase system component IIB
MQDKLEDWLEDRRIQIIGGDFNIRDKDWDEGVNRKDGNAEKLKNWCHRNGSKILNNGEYTHMDRHSGKKSTPDITIASEELAQRCKWTVTQELGSDHNPILIEADINIRIKKEVTRVAWAWKKADWIVFQNDVKMEIEKNKQTAETVREGIKQGVKRITNVILEAAKKNIPKKKCSNKNRPYLKKETIDMMRERERLRKEINSEQMMTRWKEINERIIEKIRSDKNEFWAEYVEKLEGDCHGQVWNTIRKCRDQKENNNNEAMKVN